MEPCNPRLPKYKEAAQDRKNNKGEVKAQDKIRQYACCHLLILFHNSSYPLNILSHQGLCAPS